MVDTRSSFADLELSELARDEDAERLRDRGLVVSLAEGSATQVLGECRRRRPTVAVDDEELEQLPEEPPPGWAEP
ncbi:MAG: hypothetical protein DWQ35_00330 [Planctomycetota bacterium]|nr:MAG: hypothetical protein DWQ35_00330 [Planctomycetota bacterium]